MALEMVFKITWASRISYRGRRLVARFARDRRGLAAVEFAFIVPLMLTLMFGTIEISSAVAVDRKVTLAARTISDLVSQSPQVTSADLKNYFGLGAVIIAPYTVTSATLTQKISAVTIDANGKATVAWSYKGSVSGGTATVGASDNNTGDVVTAQIPAALLVPNTQLIWSVVTYTYSPIVKYVINANIPLSDQCFTRPRQSNTVTYSS
jgi:Flp pilus assembly protein TadG